MWLKALGKIATFFAMEIENVNTTIYSGWLFFVGEVAFVPSLSSDQDRLHVAKISLDLMRERIWELLERLLGWKNAISCLMWGFGWREISS